MVSDPNRPARLRRLRSLVSVVPVLPVRGWFTRWFRSLSEHVSNVGADTRQVILRSRDDVVHQLRADREALTDRLRDDFDRLVHEVRTEANGVAEVALATERRLARLESAIAVLLAEGDASSTSTVDGPWVHRALAGSDPSTVVLQGAVGRLADELRAAGHLVVAAAADRTADLVVVADPADDVGGILEAARRALVAGGRVVLAADGVVDDKALDGWAILDERTVERAAGGWRAADRATASTRSLYLLG